MVLRLSAVVVVPWLVLAGCAAEVPAEIGSGPADEVDGVSLNGVSLNGVSLNGVSLNGVSLNGVSLNGVSLNGVSLNGVSLNGVSLNGTQLVGTRGGVTVKDVAFVGATFVGQLSNGGTLNLRIDTMTQGAAPNADVWMAGVSYQSSTGWASLCVDPATGAATQAIPMVGTWSYASGVVGGGAYTKDTTKITFACRKTAIAKCMEMGYKPWAPVKGVDLTNHLVACTRLLRADYCGDGTPHTVTGTTINLYDALGIQTDDQAWTPEAEWTAAGARCLSSPASARWMLVKGSLDACIAKKITGACGSPPNFAAGTLLVDEYRDAVDASKVK